MEEMIYFLNIGLQTGYTLRAIELPAFPKVESMTQMRQCDLEQGNLQIPRFQCRLKQ